jgi:heme oxygenase (biliverdin-IX-beta and delta-forming)
MSEPSFPALAELRRATSDLHAQLEEVLQVNRDGADQEEYIDYLQDMHGWLRMVEPALWHAEWPQAIHAADRLGKLDRIESDLVHAGMSGYAIFNLPVPDYAPELDIVECRYGVAYVVEGAQLGVRVLARRLEAVLHGWQPAWLQGYGDHSAQRWKEFIACSEAQLQSHQARQAAAEYARQAFVSLLEWFTIRHKARRCSEITISGERF